MMIHIIQSNETNETHHLRYYNMKICYIIFIKVRPLWVKLQGENKPLSAGHPYDLQCVVVGARPEPTIKWWLGSVLMTNASELVSF